MSEQNRNEKQFRLLSLGVLALTALACVQEPLAPQSVSERSEAVMVIQNAATVAPPVQIEIDSLSEVEAMNTAARLRSFAYGKSGL